MRELAEYAVRKLRKPQSLKRTSPLPIAAWDGCTMLKRVLPEPDKYSYRPDGPTDPFSGCQAPPNVVVGTDINDTELTVRTRNVDFDDERTS